MHGWQMWLKKHLWKKGLDKYFTKNTIKIDRKMTKSGIRNKLAQMYYQKKYNELCDDKKEIIKTQARIEEINRLHKNKKAEN